MAGEKSGSLVEVLDRYITYQKLALAVRKKVLVSLMYPSVLIVLVILLMVFLVTYVVPSFAELYNSMSAQAADDHAVSDRDRHHGARRTFCWSRRPWSARSSVFRLVGAKANRRGEDRPRQDAKFRSSAISG